MQDPLALAAALGVATASIRICMGVVPVFNRAVPVLATGVVAAEQRAPGRFVLGLGISTRNMVDRWYGLPFERPLDRACVRPWRCSAGSSAARRRISLGTAVRSHGFRLRELPTAPVPIHVAAMGAPMLELAGEIADGVVLNDFTPVDRLPWALERIDAGARRNGRRVDDLEIVHRRALRVVETAADTPNALEDFRNYLAFYGSAPAYQEGLIALGYGAAVEEIRAGYATRDRARTMRAVADEMVDRVFCFGTAEVCHARIRALYAAGVDTIAVSPQASDATTWARSAEAFTPES